MKRTYHLQLSDRMFDFKEFYRRIAAGLPNACSIAEIGLADGVSSIFLGEALLDLRKSFKLWAIDNLAYGGYDQLQTLLRHYHKAGLQDVVEVITLDSLNASCRFPDHYFDFVFIDSSHEYQQTKAELRVWTHKIKEGGVLAGHDYNTKEGAKVKKAVDEFFAPDKLQVISTEKDYGVWCVKL